MSNYSICAYMRLSDEDRDLFGHKAESESITSQRRLIHNFINEHSEFNGCSVIEKYDDGFSGRYFDTRPQFKEMIELAKKGKINCIIVKDCSRFGRDYVELGDYLEQLFPFLGIRFIAINDHYDSQTCKGGLDIAFKNLVYDIYSRDLSRKIKESHRQMAFRGEYSAGETIYGYRKKQNDRHQLEIDPVAAAVVREIYDMKMTGMGLTEIARTLNNRGIKSPSAYKHEKGVATCRNKGFENMLWTAATIRQILTNEKYTGTLVRLETEVDLLTGKQMKRSKDEQIRIENAYEPIISKEEFQRVKNTFFKSITEARPYKKMHYRCGICGKKLKRRNKDDLYCICGNLSNETHRCKSVKGKEARLNKIVYSCLKERLSNVMDLEALTLQTKPAQIQTADLKELKRKLETAKKDKQLLFEKLADRKIDGKAFIERKRDYDTEISRLEKMLSADEYAKEAIRNTGIEYNEKMQGTTSFTNTKTMTEKMWETFVKDVSVYPDDRVEIRWRFEA